ncbi:MAG TPA: hypothetical protein VM510_05350, partial [Caulifigura sp.]|nr:hypothetical protein [Caulifigura sp.]
MLTPDQITLLHRFSDSWPASLQLTFFEGQPAARQSHSLAYEISAFSEGRAASLPFFVTAQDEVAWITLAPDDQQLRAAIEELRAWVLPSFGWEDPRGAMVLPGEVAGPLSQLCSTMSPAGYFRWKTTTRQADRVFTKLRQRRELEQVRPRHAARRLPSLYELRREFAVALTVGDRPAAEEVVAAIDRRQLDTADNTLFMRIRLWGSFGDSASVVTHADLDRLLSIRMPHRIRLSIIEAFHSHFLASLEDEGRIDDSSNQYAAEVHDLLSGLIAMTNAADSLPARRLLAYRASALADAGQARGLLAGAPDPVLKHLLSALAQQGAEPPPSLEARFLDARKRRDWRYVQEIGEELIGDHPEYIPILRHSLGLRPNQALHLSLDAVEARAPADTAEVGAAPKTWAEWFALLRGGRPTSLETFLEEQPARSWGNPGAEEVQGLRESLDELYTDPAVSTDNRLRHTMMSGLVELADQCIKDPRFPRPGLADVYLGLFRLWGSLNRGSIYGPDSQVLLELGEAVLQFGREAESEVVDFLRAWWEARRVKALLPFLLGAVEMLDRIGSDGQCENLWVVAGQFVRSDPDVLSPGERLLWRRTGARIGYDDATLDEYVPLPESAADADPIRNAAFTKIAIVSLRGRQAHEAAGLLRDRSDAQIVVVEETHPGPATTSALSAD